MVAASTLSRPCHARPCSSARRRALRVALLLVALEAGCGAAPTEAEAPTPTAEVEARTPTAAEPAAGASLIDDCRLRLDEASALQKTQSLDAAATALAQAWEVCGDGKGVLERQAQVAILRGDAAAAAEFLYREVSEPPASEFSFELLAALFPKLPAKAQRQFANLGSGPDHPVEAPSPKAQVAWVTHVVCGGFEPENFGSGTMEHGGRQLELLVFDCADGKEHEVYFVAAPDPLQQMFEERLGP